MKESERFQKVISRIKEKAAEVLPEGSSVTLYGSRARGDARPDSDWDLHILIPGPEKQPWEDIASYNIAFEQLGWEINEEINAVTHTYAAWAKNWFMPLYINIRDEGILL